MNISEVQIDKQGRLPETGAAICNWAVWSPEIQGKTACDRKHYHYVRRESNGRKERAYGQSCSTADCGKRKEPKGILYPAEELDKGRLNRFNTKEECVVAALKYFGKKEATIKETEELVKKFLQKEVKLMAGTFIIGEPNSPGNLFQYSESRRKPAQPVLMTVQRLFSLKLISDH